MRSLISRWLIVALCAAPLCACGRSALEPPAKGDGQPQPGAGKPEGKRGDAEYRERLASFFDAADRGQTSRVRQLLKEGADVSDKDEKGETALMKAAAKGHSGVIEVLLEQKAHINDRDAEGRTALMHAAAGGHGESVKMLLTRGAGREVQDKEGRTALMHAALRDQAACVQAAFTFDTARIRDNEGKTALAHATAKGHLRAVEELARLMSSGNWEEYPAFLAATDKQGRTPLMHAAAAGHQEVVKVLLAGFDRNTTVIAWNEALAKQRAPQLGLRDRGGKTAAQLAREAGHTEIAALLEGKK